MQKAKSRLNSSKTTFRPPNFLPKTSISFLNPLIQYFHHLPTLVIGLVFLAPLLAIVNWVQPSTIQNLIFPNSYLPAVVLFFLASFFLSSFFLLHTRRGFFFALVSTLLLFLKLQNFNLNPLTIASPIAIFIILELFLSLILKDKLNPDSK